MELASRSFNIKSFKLYSPFETWSLPFLLNSIVHKVLVGMLNFPVERSWTFPRIQWIKFSLIGLSGFAFYFDAVFELCKVVSSLSSCLGRGLL